MRDHAAAMVASTTASAEPRTSGVAEHCPDLSISIVVYRLDSSLLETTLASVSAAVSLARHNRRLGRVSLFLIDNGSDRAKLATLTNALLRTEKVDDVLVRSGHGNIGYGAGHNIALQESAADYHLVLNPDVELDPDALLQGLDFMQRETGAGLLAAAVRDPAGCTQYLCKRYPTILDLLLRGFSPSFARRLFRQRLDRYELRDRIGDTIVWDVPLASGCFMLLRRSVVQSVGGFDPHYFLYFEDFDLSLRLAQAARLVYVPAVRIVHHGGNAAQKGYGHVRLFVRSAIRFFNRYGWALW